MTATGSITISAKGLAWNRRGHLWIYRDDVERADMLLSGHVVEVYDNAQHCLGRGFFNPNSKIAVRLLTANGETVNEEFWKARLQQAIQRRDGLSATGSAYRLVSSEADLCPGLIVDRYGDVLVMQTLCLGMDRIKSLIVELLVECIKPSCIVERNDVAIRQHEGLPQQKGVLYGTLPERLEVREGDIRLLVDPMNGQKTGLYLDQRENHLNAARYAAGTVLDCFAYQGGASLQAARHAERVTAVESSGTALNLLRANAELNGIANIVCREENVFDALKDYERQRQQFDFIILDPPAFAKSRSNLSDAARGYGQINTRALRLLKPGGHLMTCSCSYNLSSEKFLQILQRAAGDAQRQVRVVEQRFQPTDHPVLLSMPETHYLKTFVLQAIQ